MSENQYESLGDITTPEIAASIAEQAIKASEQKASSPYKEYLALIEQGTSKENALALVKKDAVVLFADALAQYPTLEEAKKHRVEIAEKLGCADSLMYKAIKKLDKFKGKAEKKSRTATIKISDVKPEAIEPIEEPEEPETISDLSTDEAPPTLNVQKPTFITEQPTQPTLAASKPTVQPVAPDEVKLAAMSRVIVQGSKRLAAWKKFAGFEIPQDEADLLAPDIMLLLGDSAGAIDPRYLAALNVGFAVGGRALEYMEYRKTQEKQEITPSRTLAPTPEPVAVAEDVKPLFVEPTTAPEEPQFNDTRPKWAKGKT